MIKKAPVNARLDTNIANALKAEANARGITTTDLLEEILTEHQAVSGPTGAERKIASLEALVKEQERVVRKHTGRATPRRRRISLTISHEAAQRLEAEATDAGMTKSELVDSALMSAGRKRTIIQAKPALRASV